MLPAKLAHQLSREAWERLAQRELERALARVESAVLQATRTGAYSVWVPARSVRSIRDLKGALEQLGYKCEAQRRGKHFVVSWGAAGGAP